MHKAIYFDGVSARLHPVQLAFGDGRLQLSGAAAGADLAVPLAQVRLAEVFEGAPAVLYLPGGGRCEVGAPEAKAAAVAAIGERPSLVMRCQRHWLAALAALVLLLALGAAIWWVVLPAAAERIAASVPARFDEHIGASALRTLEARMLQPTTLSPGQVRTAQDLLTQVSPARPRHRLRLLVRNAPLLGPNALALPDGTIVITDQLLIASLEKDGHFSDASKAAIAGVLAHEVGHVEQRHSVRVLARTSLTAAASTALFGDFSAVAAGVPALLNNLHYSRAMETEADEYALATLQARHISPVPLADLLDWLDGVDQNSGQRNMPRWMKQALPYASSHPGAPERSARLRAAGR